jgi:hypothetical protein
MSEIARVRDALHWGSLRRSDGVNIEQARARNNSWYIIVPQGDGAWQLRYASQSGNFEILTTRGIDEAKRAAENHADRYDTRA